MSDVEIMWPGPGIAGINSPKTDVPVSVKAGTPATGTVSVDIVYHPPAAKIPDPTAFLRVWVFPKGGGPNGANGLDFDFQGKPGKKKIRFGNGKVSDLSFDLQAFGLSGKPGDSFDLLIGYFPSENAPSATDHEIVVGAIVVM